MGIIVGSFGLGIWWLSDYLGWTSQDVLVQGEAKVFESTATSESSQAESSEVPWKIEEVARGLTVPWSLVFTGNNRILISERAGQIRALINHQLQSQPLITLPVSSSEEEGLMGLVLDPDYESNQTIYACYAYDSGDTLMNRVVRLIDESDRLTEGKVIIDNIPAAKFHAGCRLGFDPDSKLYVTTGDATDKELAQDLNSLAGKILRLNPDGTTPSDNPFNGSLIYSYGHRNPQGIDWHPETGQLYSSEHGPSVFDGPAGGDEVNLIKAGANYGWPTVSHNATLEGTEAPLVQFTPAEAPGSLLVYSGKVFPQYRNQIFFGALKGEGIVRLKLDTTGAQIVEEEKLPIEVGRVRDVVESPEGYIYFTTSNADGRGEVREGDDKVYRLVSVQ